jgi:hypothetical protein
MVVRAVGVVGKPHPEPREGERLLQAKPDVSLLCGDCETPLLMEVGEEERARIKPKGAFGFDTMSLITGAHPAIRKGEIFGYAIHNLPR